MKTKFNYLPDSMEIFPGFYESYLYNPDMEYDYNEEEKRYLGDDYVECELDFDAYKKEVCEIISYELEEFLTNNEKICDSCKLYGLSSPQYYNYSTDKLDLELNIDFDELKNWLYKSEKRMNGFNAYLKEKYSSCSGFISFVSNNIKEYFEEDYYEDRYASVLIDYYLLSQMMKTEDLITGMKNGDMDGWMYILCDLIQEPFYNNMIPIKTEEIV